MSVILAKRRKINGLALPALLMAFLAIYGCDAISKTGSRSKIKSSDFNEIGPAIVDYKAGQMFLDGVRVPQNHPEALRLFRLSAGKGLADAQYELARMYQKGQGAPPGNAQAYTWYFLAAEQGIEKAKAEIAIIAPQLTSDQIKEAEKEAAEIREGMIINWRMDIAEKK